jgi:bacterioferritin-associated ferredoxin
MACAVHPVPASGSDGGARLMTRCECAGTSFEEVARQVVEEGRPAEEVARRSGCGQTCTACLPDLRRYLASLRRD